MAIGKEDIEIVKPLTDNREYRRIVLHNSLQVLIISDPETEKCAAAMNVAVGAFCDPDGLEGLAHFLEHMLFFASEKYPLEDSYSKYIAEHGGSTNAYTSSESTNYYFDVNSDGFEEALDRFAQFFTKPLMSADATMREIKAVDSGLIFHPLYLVFLLRKPQENQKNLLSDPWRMQQLQKHFSKEGHPYHKFSTGNWDTLAIRPKENGVDIRDELIKFYKEHYSSNLMHLVVYGKGSLDKLQSLVENIFREIPNSDKSAVHFPGNPCTPEHLQILVKTVPIKEGHKLRFVWPVTPGILHYKEGPSRYLSHLIGHEGEGSLFHVLKTLGWATGLSAGESDWTSAFSFFKVGIDLTDDGHDHVKDVIGLLFKYIQLLQESGVSKWIFDELSAACETDFHYQDKTRAIDYVVNIASNMQMYPPKDWLVGSSLPSNFNPAIIKVVLNELSPDNVRLFWESKRFEGHTDKVEPWYGTSYSIERISVSEIQKWVSYAPDQNLHLPVPNVFIPTDLSLKDAQHKEKYPILLKKSICSKLWYKPDTLFSTPKAYVKIYFHCPASCGSPKAEVLTDIFTRLLMDYLNEYAYYAQVAGLDYAISQTDCGFEVTVSGYNHKLRLLLDTVIQKIVTFEVKPDRFTVIKELAIKEYQNFRFQQPYQQAMYYCLLILEDNTWPLSEMLEVLPYLEAEDLAKFASTMLSMAFLECYVAGNIENSEAESMVQHIEDVFFGGPNPLSQPLCASQHLTNRVVKLGRSLNYVYSKKVLNPNEKNSALVHYIQVHQDDFVFNAKLQLFTLVAKEPAFHQLRSVEQLGYITALLQRNDSGIRGVQIIIQSSQKGPGHLDSRIEAFLKMFESRLRDMTIEEFKSHVNALIDMKLEKHKNLKEESRFYWREVSDGTLKFDRREAEIAALKQLTQQELIDFFNEFIKVGAPKRKSLSIRVYGNLHMSELKSDVSESSSVQIDDIFSFRRSQPLYGSFRGGIAQTKL